MQLTATFPYYVLTAQIYCDIIIYNIYMLPILLDVQDGYPIKERNLS